MRLATMTWTQVEDHLKKSDLVVIPIGSTEQHGPTGLIGTDALTADAIAIRAAERAGVVCAPSINYGMALHHMAFPGTVSLRPSTLLQVIVEVAESLVHHGFRRLLFVNGHGGNIPTVTAAFSEIKRDVDKSALELLNWWRLEEVQAYEKEQFGDQNGFHATIGEVAATQYLEPAAFEKIPKTQFKIERPKHHWPLSPSEFHKFFPDGRMESNPGLANRDHGNRIFEIAVEATVRHIEYMKGFNLVDHQM